MSSEIPENWRICLTPEIDPNVCLTNLRKIRQEAQPTQQFGIWSNTQAANIWALLTINSTNNSVISSFGSLVSSIFEVAKGAQLAVRQ